MELEIEVPSHFLCPISMQPMKDPVTISTGITYDRESIHKWLFTCTRTTCPVTKQPLSSTDLIPNHTLRRLIHSWSTTTSLPASHPIPAPKNQIANLLHDAKTDPRNQITCLRKLRSVITCMENDIDVAHLGLFEFLTAVMLTENETSVSFVTEACDEALTILHLLKFSDLTLRKVNGLGLPKALLHVMTFGTVPSRSRAVIMLRSVFKVMDRSQIGCVDPVVFTQTGRILKSKVSQQTFKACLEVVVDVVKWGRNRIKAAESGIVFALIDLLIESADRRICELALVALEQICRCAEGRAGLVEHAAGLATVSKKILRVSHVGSDRAVRILCSVCRFCGSDGVLHEMVEVGVVAKLCLMIQIDYSERTKERVKEVLILHSRVWKGASCVPAHLLSSYPSL
ncbi:hypothetical protein SSX86_019856 [Deinandra increscens subsp. villosa]|uniref:U-box domain-containing protein n=1 Tax=Deinandra increscens subsp. villosa TaxID=3103831 RepID=A0AAP0GW45_9ASTR